MSLLLSSHDMPYSNSAPSLSTFITLDMCRPLNILISPKVHRYSGSATVRSDGESRQTVEIARAAADDPRWVDQVDFFLQMLTLRSNMSLRRTK